MANKRLDAIRALALSIYSSCVRGVRFGFFPIFRIQIGKLGGCGRRCGSSGPRPVFVVALEAERQLVERAGWKVRGFKVRRGRPPDAGRLGRKRADAALRENGAPVVDEGVYERALPDPRVADEADGAFFANLLLPRGDALQFSIEIVDPLRSERLEKPADVVLVPPTDLLDGISVARTGMHVDFLDAS